MIEKISLLKNFFLFKNKNKNDLREDRISISDRRNRIIDDGESTLRTEKSFDSSSVMDSNNISRLESGEVLNGKNYFK